jgi:hypothetical protein
MKEKRLKKMKKEDQGYLPRRIRCPGLYEKHHVFIQDVAPKATCDARVSEQRAGN